jgi:hypothetical protein
VGAGSEDVAGGVVGAGSEDVAGDAGDEVGEGVAWVLGGAVMAIAVGTPSMNAGGSSISVSMPCGVIRNPRTVWLKSVVSNPLATRSRASLLLILSHRAALPPVFVLSRNTGT